MTETEEAPDLDPRWHGAFIPENDWHFHRNLLKRYGAILGPGEYSRIGEKIAEGKFMLIERRQDRESAVYAVRIKNSKQCVFIVAFGRKLVTALPPTKRLRSLRKALRTAAG